MSQLLLSEQEILQRLDDDFADSNLLFDGLFLDCVPQLVIDANSAKWCGCHLDCLSDCTNFGIIQYISHSNDVFVTSLDNFVSSFTLDEVVIPHHKKVSTNITGELATIVCALMALIANQAFDSARFNHLFAHHIRIVFRNLFCNLDFIISAIVRETFFLIFVTTDVEICNSCYRVVQTIEHISSRTCSNREVTFRIGFSTIDCCAITASHFDISFNAFQDQQFSNFVHIEQCTFHFSPLHSAPELVSVYTGYTSVYTGASLVGGVSNG